MRHSSMKSVVAALSICVTLFFAVPTATAATAQGPRNPQTTRSRDDAPTTDRFAAVRQFIHRAIRRIGAQSGISVPIPKAAPPVEPE